MSDDNDGLDEFRFLTIKQISSLINTTPQNIYRWQRDGKFPPRVRLGDHKVGVPRAAFRKWLAERPVIQPSADE